MRDHFPASAPELREVVAVMRELGVTRAFGIELGPVPPPPAPKLTPEAEAEAKRAAGLEAKRAEVRLLLNLSDDTPNEVVDRYLESHA